MGKKIGIMMGALGLIFALTFYMNRSEPVYGNNKDSIVQVIQAIEGYEDKKIELLKVKDFDDVRVAGFLSNDQPSYITFQKNEEGNYVWNYIEFREDESFSMFLPLVGSEKKILFITNRKNEIAEIQVDINGNTLKQEFPSQEATVTSVDLPESDDYEFRNYTYFDEEGKEIQRD
ncbi:hypothetical protein [Alkalihalobacillus sp. R86527]|uniref:hypothetical protein n=1 Tax=Alkalihalobacillus sp. R86527 TaxID=3093863 RepID=UPI003670C78F